MIFETTMHVTVKLKTQNFMVPVPGICPKISLTVLFRWCGAYLHVSKRKQKYRFSI